MNKKIMLSALMAAGLVAMNTASAATATTTFQVTATVVANCKIDSATDMAFGTYSPTAGDVTATSQIKVRCSKGATYTLGLDAGTTAGGSIAQRLMAKGTDTLQYNLYSDAARTSVWGNSSGSWVSGTGAGLGTPNTITHTVYGKLPDSAVNQDAAVGNYADTITATLTY